MSMRPRRNSAIPKDLVLVWTLPNFRPKSLTWRTGLLGNSAMIPPITTRAAAKIRAAMGLPDMGVVGMPDERSCVAKPIDEPGAKTRNHDEETCWYPVWSGSDPDSACFLNMFRFSHQESVFRCDVSRYHLSEHPVSMRAQSCHTSCIHCQWTIQPPF